MVLKVKYGLSAEKDLFCYAMRTEIVKAIIAVVRALLLYLKSVKVHCPVVVGVDCFSISDNVQHNESIYSSYIVLMQLNFNPNSNCLFPGFTAGVAMPLLPGIYMYVSILKG